MQLPVISYVVAALMELADGGEVAVEARGESISRAIDAVRAIRTKYLSGSSRVLQLRGHLR